MRLNTNHNFLAFEAQIDRSVTWFSQRAMGACGHSARVLAERVGQRLAELGLQPYTLAVHRLACQSDNPFPAPGSRIDCGRLVMEIGSGRLSVTPSQWLANTFEFLVHWMFCIAAIVAAKPASGSRLPATLVIDVGDENVIASSGDEEFVRYCRSGPVAPLRDATRLLVQTSEDHTSSDAALTYCRRPLITLTREAKLGFLRRARLISKQVLLFFEYFAAAIRLPSLSILGKDFAYSRISLELDERGLMNSVVTTCSSFTSQPLWMRSLRRAQVHMIWYSQNWQPIAYKDDPARSRLPSLPWIRVDTHWVWTHAFAEYLRHLGLESCMEVVGPVLWKAPRIANPPKGPIQVVIFDVPAVDDEVLLKFCGELTNYFHESKVRAFIDDVISLKPALEERFGMPVSLCLKMKRGWKNDYNKGYYDHIASLGATGTLTLESHTRNLFELISGSHLVIAYPFTSPAYVAEFLHVPAIYYDPTQAIVWQAFCDSDAPVLFAAGRGELLESASTLLNKVFPVRATSSA